MKLMRSEVGPDGDVHDTAPVAHGAMIESEVTVDGRIEDRASGDPPGVKWFVANSAETCDATCKEMVGQACDRLVLEEKVGEIETKEAFDRAGRKCPSMNNECTPGNCHDEAAPYTKPDSSSPCYFTSTDVAPCDKAPKSADHRRLCPCVVPILSSDWWPELAKES